MRNVLLLLIVAFYTSCNQNLEENKLSFNYPVAPSEPVYETYFDTTIQDDYRNLENLNDSLVLNWFKEEGKFADNMLNEISGRAELIEKMIEYDSRKSYRVTNIEVTEKDEYFFLKQGADEDVARLFYRKSFNDKDELLYDAKSFKPDSGNTYVINYIQPSWDGSYLVVAMTHSGAEISEMIIIDMKTRKPLSQVIDHCWPSDGGGVSWLPDNSGFMYLHYPEIDHTSDKFLKDMKSVLYKLGDDPKKLHVLLSRETNPELKLSPEDFPIASLQSKDDKYIFGYIGGATAYYDCYFAEKADLGSDKLHWKRLHKKEDKINGGIFVGEDFIFKSAKNAPNFRLLRTSMNTLDLDNSEVIVEEKKDEVLSAFGMTSDGLYYTTVKNGVEAKLYFKNENDENEIPLPGASGRVNIDFKGSSFSDLWVSAMGWKNEYVRFKYDAIKKEFKKEDLAAQAEYPEFRDFVVKEVLVPGHDGEEIPLSIIHKKGIELNGQHPTLLLGYGSYGISYRPFFSPTRLTWVEEGGVFCIAHARGGSEKGDKWYQAGKKTTKPNTWKDLISCTEYVIEKGYTNKNKTVIHGRSAGGILIGRAMTERPELFAVAIPEVGMMNPLRNEVTPNGPNNTKEFGTSKDAIECKALIEMDSYLNIQKGTKYPATLITTGMNDPRVIAWQPGKFAAKLQALNASDKPIVFHVDYQSGHGISDTKSKQFDQIANVFAFAFWQVGHPKYQLKERIVEF